VNLEGPIGDGPAATLNASGVKLRQAPGTPSLLRRAGVRIATLANNHVLDQGERGRDETFRRLGDQGILVAQRERVAVVSPGGTFSVLAFDLTEGLPPELGRAVESSAGLRIVSLHVTQPPSYLPSEVLVRAVGVALAAGARVVVAHGSHMPARVERREGAVIAWGLGNLVFDCECTRETDGLLLSIKVSPNGALDAAVMPIRAGLDGKPARPSEDVGLMADLLRSLRSSPLRRDGPWLRF
jgi:poly-gamma-glutamate capsule biosynthesis protein CapA/YwtB (metallophosphatase superfamily)